MKLTKAQRIMLDEAEMVNHEARENDRWFIPNKSDPCIVYGTKATAKALCGKGLLEYRVLFQAVGRLPEIMAFKITAEGLQTLKS